MNHIPLPHQSIKSSVRSSSLTAAIGLIGGIALQSVKEDLLLVVPLLIALPALNAMAGDYATLINAHIADPENSRASKKKLLKSLLICVPVSAFGVIAASLFLAQSQGYAIDTAFVFTFAQFVIASFAIIVGITMVTSIALNRLLIQRRINSDDVLIPLSNVMASVLMLLCVSFAAWRLF